MTVDIKGIGKITASKRLLNELSISLWVASEAEESKGHHDIAKRNEKISDSILLALKEDGYYFD